MELLLENTDYIKRLSNYGNQLRVNVTSPSVELSVNLLTVTIPTESELIRKYISRSYT